MSSNPSTSRNSTSEGIEITTCVDASGASVIAGPSTQQQRSANLNGMDFNTLMSMNEMWANSRRNVLGSGIQRPGMLQQQTPIQTPAQQIVSAPTQHNHLYTTVQREADQRQYDPQRLAATTVVPNQQELLNTTSDGLLQQLRLAARRIAEAQTATERDRFLTEGGRVADVLVLYNQQQRAVLESPAQYMTREGAGIKPDMNLEDMIRTFTRLEQRCYGNERLTVEEHITLYQRLHIVAQVIRETISARQEKRNIKTTDTVKPQTRELTFASDFDDARNIQQGRTERRSDTHTDTQDERTGNNNHRTGEGREPQGNNDGQNRRNNGGSNEYNSGYYGKSNTHSNYRGGTDTYGAHGHNNGDNNGHEYTNNHGNNHGNNYYRNH